MKKITTRILSAFLVALMLLTITPFGFLTVAKAAGAKSVSGSYVVDNNGKFMEAYKATFECTNRTESTATIKITWKYTIYAGYYDNYQYDFEVKCGGKTTGRKTIVPAKTWSSGSSKSRSKTVSTNLNVPMSTTNAATISLVCIQYQCNTNGSVRYTEKKEPGTVKYSVPAYQPPQTTYTVTYNANGGSVSPASASVTSGSSTALPTPTRSGYTCLGWAASSTATSASYACGSSFKPTANITLYAVWSKTENNYVVTYNANGGAVSPASASVKQGNTVTLPTPTRSGYTCLGWATSSTATAAAYTCGASFKPAGNITLYAVWKKDTVKFGTNHRFSFVNSYNNFCTSSSYDNSRGYYSYYVSKADMNKLTDYIKKYDKKYYKSTISSVQDYRNSEWGGSCYGMSCCAILDFYDDLSFNEKFGASNIHAVPSPNTNSSIMSYINYYQISQLIGFTNNKTKNYANWEEVWTEGLKGLVNAAKQEKPFLFCYFFIDSEGYYSGHAIVAYDYELGSDGKHYIKAYDNRYPNANINIVVNSAYSSCTVQTPEYNEKCLSIEYTTNMSAINKIDYDGPANDGIISYSSEYSNSESAYIEVLVDGDVSITNENNETLTITNGVVGGTMDIISRHIIVNSTADGQAAPPKIVFEIAESRKISVESTSDNINVSYLTDDMYASASASNADYVVFGNNSGVYVMGDDIGYTTTLSSKTDDYDTVILTGNSENDISMVYDSATHNIVAKGVDGNNDSFKVFSNITNEQDLEFKPGYNTIMIMSDEDGDIGIYSASQSTPSIESYIKIAGYTESRTIDYKATITFHADVKNASEIQWDVEGADYTQNSDGSITVKNATSDFEVSCSAYGQNGIISSEKEKVSVKQGFFAKLIAFFRNLFGRLPVIDQK